jgi:hypothetical protein
MARTSVIADLDHAVAEYTRLRDAGCDFAAVAWYEEATQYADRLGMSLSVEVPSSAVLEHARSAIAEQVKTHRDIMSRRVKFEYEEIILLLTICINLDLVLVGLKRFGFTADREAKEVASLEEDMTWLCNSKENRAAFRSAVMQIRRASHLESRWLELPMRLVR